VQSEFLNWDGGRYIRRIRVGGPCGRAGREKERKVKSLPEMVSNLRGLSSLLLEAAEEVDQVIRFFGGGLGETPALQQGSHFMGVPQSPQPIRAKENEPPPVARGGLPARKLTKGDKHNIAADYLQLPEHLRTKENRRALAAKYQCGVMQIAGIVTDIQNRGNGLAKARAARAARAAVGGTRREVRIA
jgi:hypothetical protein